MSDKCSYDSNTHKYPYPYGYCGMPCALCTRYRTDGNSRCNGFSHGGYYTDVCKVHRCCREKKLLHCGECDGYPCERLGKMGDFRDLDTGHVKPRTSSFIAENGFDAWYSDYEQRAAMLTYALEKFNDGRMKRFICELFIKNDSDTLKKLLLSAASLTGTKKEVGKAFRELVSAMEQKI